MQNRIRGNALALAVDVHTHFVPSEFPAPSGRNALWPSIERRGDTAAIVIDGKVFRKIDSRSWDAIRRLDDMGLDDVDAQVVSPMPELLSHWLPAVDADALCDHINVRIAALCAAHPDRFFGMGMVPMQDTSLALRRIADLKALGLKGFEIGTHINGIPLGAAQLNEIYAAAESSGLMIMVHALHPLGIERMGGRPELAAVAAFPLETALAAVSLMASGVPERFPNLRIMLSHGGGALSWILPRLRHAYNIGPPLSELFPSDPSAAIRRFHYDTILYDASALRFLADNVGMDQLVAGSDYPFSIKQDRPVAFSEASLSIPRQILFANAMRLLGIEDASSIQ